MKYYKIVQDNSIIGAVSSRNFIQYSPVVGCFLRSNEQDGEYISFQGKLYRDTWMSPIQMQQSYTLIRAIEINEEEYQIYIQAIENNETIVDDPDEPQHEIPEIIDPIDIASVEFIRESKIKEMSYICRTTIESGIDLEIRGEIKHFSLTTQDQLNLMSAQTMAQTQTLIPYHADGEETDFYTNEEINQIAEAAAAFKVQHTTYYNSLKTYINALETIEEISAITYGVEIPDEYKSDVLKVLEQ